MLSTDSKTLSSKLSSTNIHTKWLSWRFKHNLHTSLLCSTSQQLRAKLWTSAIDRSIAKLPTQIRTICAPFHGKLGTHGNGSFGNRHTGASRSLGKSAHQIGLADIFPSFNQSHHFPDTASFPRYGDRITPAPLCLLPFTAAHFIDSALLNGVKIKITICMIAFTAGGENGRGKTATAVPETELTKPGNVFVCNFLPVLQLPFICDAQEGGMGECFLHTNQCADFFYIGSVGESFFAATELEGIERKDKNLGEDLGLQGAIVVQQERKL